MMSYKYGGVQMLQNSCKLQLKLVVSQYSGNVSFFLLGCPVVAWQNRLIYVNITLVFGTFS